MVVVARAKYFREKAAQCRRLANSITARDDPTEAALLSLAAEFEATAQGVEAMAVTEAALTLS